MIGAVLGVALTSLVLEGALAHKAVRYAATLPGIYGDIIAFVAELAISFFLMSAILFASNHEVLAPYTHYFAAILAAIYIAFESPLSGMSTNPARMFGPALYGSYWHALWIYFIAPPLGMLAAAEVFLLARERKGPYCAKLHLPPLGRAVRGEKISADWLAAISDAVFAVIVTVMVLELRAADQLCPTGSVEARVYYAREVHLTKYSDLA